MSECQECQQKQTRIDQLEAMIQRMSDSFDGYLARLMSKDQPRKAEDMANITKVERKFKF